VCRASGRLRRLDKRRSGGPSLRLMRHQRDESSADQHSDRSPAGPAWDTGSPTSPTSPPGPLGRPVPRAAKRQAAPQDSSVRLFWPTDHRNYEFNLWVTRRTAARWLRDALLTTRRWSRIYTLRWYVLYDNPLHPRGVASDHGARATARPPQRCEDRSCCSPVGSWQCPGFARRRRWFDIFAINSFAKNAGALKRLLKRVRKLMAKTHERTKIP
jgi:hypothetical protein